MKCILLDVLLLTTGGQIELPVLMRVSKGGGLFADYIGCLFSGPVPFRRLTVAELHPARGTGSEI